MMIGISLLNSSHTLTVIKLFMHKATPFFALSYREVKLRQYDGLFKYTCDTTIINSMTNRTFQILTLVFFAVLVALLIKLPASQFDQGNRERAALRQFNNKTAGNLYELVKTKYFRILRINVNSNCPLPYMQKLCKSKSCSVCRCNQKDIPQNWIKTDKVESTDKHKDVWSQERDETPGKWIWHVEDEQNDKGEYFDVHTNVESYSGYNGSYIWSLIYQENCFKGANHFQQMCLEEQVLYKIISGLHTSISSHLSRLYKNVTGAAIWADKGDSDTFFFNHREYNQRVFAHPERIQNLLFLYEMLIRSVKKIIPYIQSNNFIASDDIAQDLHSSQLLDAIVKEVKKIDFKPLNQTDAFFFVPNNPHVKQYQRYIHNISNILNCVDCEKCRLFGKMQTYGLGTALKILLDYNLQYKRNELVAMFNTLNKISISVNTYFNYQQYLNEGIGGQEYKHLDFPKLYGITQNDELIYVKIWVGCGLVFLFFIWVIMQWDPKSKIQKQFKHAFPPTTKPRRQ